MRIQNEKAGSNSLGKRLLGLSVAALTTMTAFLVAVPGAHAADNTGVEYAVDDEFEAGPINQNKNPKLEVVKYVTTTPGGNAPTGSVNDARLHVNKNTAANVTFVLREVKAVGSKDPSTMNAADSSTYENVAGGTKYAGTTDGNGKIVTGTSSSPNGSGIWRVATSVTDNIAAAKNGTPATFPSGQHWYLLEEIQAPDGYEKAENTIFGLPYLTTGKTSDGKDALGYLYNLHIFPKNHSSGQLEKNASAIDRGSRGTFVPVQGNKDKHVQIGDSVRYEIVQNIDNGKGSKGDGKLARDEIAPNGDTLKISDRLSAALEYKDTAVRVVYTANGAQATTNVPATNYRIVGPDGANPARLVDPSLPMFAAPTSPGTQYVSVIFSGNAFLNGVPTTDVSNIQVIVTITTKVKSTNDSVGSTPGKLVNSAAADFQDNANTTDPNNPGKPKPLDPPAKNELGAAGFQVGKVNHSDNKPLAGAVFRLTDQNDPDAYLYNDGNFHKESDSAVAGLTVVEAESNIEGVVTFTALPVTDPTDPARVGGNLKYALKEYKAPKDHALIQTPFKLIDFSSYAGTWEDALAGHPAGITPPMDQLNLGKYAAMPMMVNGKSIDKVIANWKNDEEGKPIGLPLTGGKGIILLLIVGLAIMGGVLVVRNRKNSSVSRSI